MSAPPRSPLARLRAQVVRSWALTLAWLRWKGWIAAEQLPVGARLTTFNIGRGAKGGKGATSRTLPAVAAAIAAEAPDVVALQEVHEPDVAVLVERLRADHALDYHAEFAGALSAQDMQEVAARARRRAERDGSPFEEEHYRDRNSAFGVALLSRAPFTDVRVERLPGEGEARVALVARTSLDDQEVTVVSTHLATASKAAVRDEQTRHLLALAEAIDGPVLVAGDLNQEPDEVAAALGARAGSHLVAATHPDRPTLGRRTIDHVLVDPGTVVVGAKVGDPGASDHRPVTVALRHLGSRPT